MIQVDKIKEILSTRVGFRNGTETGYSIVDATNQTTLSGLYFQDASRLVTIKNIKDSQEDASISDVNFNALLTQMRQQASVNVVNKVFKGYSDFVLDVNLFPFEKSFNNLVTKTSRFVGIEVTPLANKFICVIPWVELAFDEEVTFNLYLYNSNKPKTPIQTKSVTTVAGESKIVELGWILANTSTHKGGKYYVGYFEDDIVTASAYKKDFEAANIQSRTPYFSVWPMATSYSGTTIDVEYVDYVDETGGLNIGINIYKDYTELVRANSSLFDTALQLQVGEEVLMLVKGSTRSNITERLTKEISGAINLELYGNKQLEIVGIQGKLSSEIESIRKSLFYVPKVKRATLG